MNRVELGSARPSDVDDVLALWTMAAENAARPADTPTAVDALIRRDPDALVLAKSDGILVGTVISGWDGWRYHLYRLAVHPDHRRQGIARLLLDHAESRLAALGATRIDAMVLDHNDLGQSLWTARGYDRQSEWSRWIKPV